MYREAGESPCHQCDRPARETCSCCQRPTCPKHLDAKQMCGKCDEALYRHMKADDGVAHWLALPATLLGAAGLGLAVPVLLPIAVAVPFLGFPVLLFSRKRRRRAKFFKAMRERGALPEPKKRELRDEDVALQRYEAGIQDRHYQAFEAAADPDDPPDR